MLKVYILLFRGPVFGSCIGWLTIVCDSSSRSSNAFSWPSGHSAHARKVEKLKSKRSQMLKYVSLGSV